MEGMADSREITGKILEIGIGSGLKNTWIHRKKRSAARKIERKSSKKGVKNRADIGNDRGKRNRCWKKRCWKEIKESNGKWGKDRDEKERESNSIIKEEQGQKNKKQRKEYQ